MATCVVCSTVLNASAKSRYCSNACRQRAYRMRAATGGDGADVSPARPFETGIPGAVPAEMDQFVGRRTELDTLRRMLRRHRLVTLVGAAGIGKTRLAVKAVERLPGSWSGRTAMVELDAITEAELVPQAVAVALGLRGQPDRSLTATILDALRDAPTLLIMDNCEHLVDACAEFAELALHRCPRLRLVATSREPLHIPGEMVFGVNGLALPDVATASAADLLRCDAVRLFAERAREVAHEFELTEQNVADAAAVCADLDASPLAIELATRWLPMLSITNIRTRLHNRFDLLTTSRRTRGGRQHSLREAIDWSYELLDADERTVFRRLSVLVGTFDPDTALTVCVDDRLAGGRVLALLSRLQASSLIASTSGAARLRLMESIRMYGRERLDASGETDAVQERLATWLAALAEPLINQPFWFPLANQRRLETLAGSLGSALRWAESADDERYPVLAIAMVRCWMHAGYLTEARKLLRSLLERVTCREDYRCVVLGYGGYLAAMQGDPHEAITMLTESVDLARTMDRPTWTSLTHYTLGCVLQAGELLERAHATLTESLRAAREIGEPLPAAMVTDRLAWHAVLIGDLDTAKALCDQAMAVFRAQPRVHAMGLVLHTAATIAMLGGELDRAQECYADSLRASPAAWLEIPYALEGLAMVAGRRGDPVRAVRLFSAAKAIRGSDRLHAEPIWRRQVEESIATLWDALGSAEVDRLAAQARELSQEQASEYALADSWPLSTETESTELDENEIAVARLVAHGLSNPRIAEALGVSQRTVAYRLTTIRTKTGLQSRSDIQLWAAAQLAGTPDENPR